MTDKKALDPEINIFLWLHMATVCTFLEIAERHDKCSKMKGKKRFKI
jgi:hypothetical protein